MRKLKKRNPFSKKRPLFPLKIFLVFVIFIFIGVTIVFLKADFFSIKSLSVESRGVVCADENLKDSTNLIGKNIFVIDIKTVEKKLKEKYFCIKQANLVKQYPNEVRLEITNREPAALLITLLDKESTLSALLDKVATPTADEAQITDMFLVDKEGVVFSKIAEEINIPKIYIYGKNIELGKNLTNELFSRVLKILETIKTFGIIVKDSRLISDEFLLISTTEIPKIIFRLDKIDVQLASLQLILSEAKIESKELEFIDLRFDKPVVKFAPKKS